MPIEQKAEEVADAIEEQKAIDTIGRQILEELGDLSMLYVINLGPTRALVVLPGFVPDPASGGDNTKPENFLRLATIYKD